MSIFYSPSTGGFYDDAFHGATIPSDQIEISDAQRWAMVECLNNGGSVTIDANGQPVLVDRPAPTMADVVAALIPDVQRWLDTTAQDNGYDSLASCISYRGSSVAQWNDDAVAALAWRDAVWQAAFQWQQDALANPPGTFPSSEEVIAQLPQAAQYGWVVHQPGAPG